MKKIKKRNFFKIFKHCFHSIGLILNKSQIAKPCKHSILFFGNFDRWIFRPLWCRYRFSIGGNFVTLALVGGPLVGRLRFSIKTLVFLSGFLQLHLGNIRVYLQEFSILGHLYFSGILEQYMWPKSLENVMYFLAKKTSWFQLILLPRKQANFIVKKRILFQLIFPLNQTSWI